MTLAEWSKAYKKNVDKLLRGAYTGELYMIGEASTALQKLPIFCSCEECKNVKRD